jgi:hypothetical protein
MDQVMLATLAAAVTVLATECGKGVATEAGKDIWTKIKSLFGWTAEPKPSELFQAIATRLSPDESLVKEVRKLLQETPNTGRASASQLIGLLVSDHALVANIVNVQGGIKFSSTHRS